jgi:hypothetical protein
MYLTALFSVHPPSDPDHNREFALGANTTSYRLATSLQVFALISLILGMFALYAIIAHGPLLDIGSGPLTGKRRERTKGGFVPSGNARLR